MTYYGTAAAFTAYHTGRGRSVVEYDEDEINVALLIASEWLDGSFGARWPGYKIGDREQQERDWPRSFVQDREGYPVDAESVPVEIERATYEAAYRQLTDATGLLSDHTNDRYRRVSIEGAISVEYRGLDAMQVQKQFPIIGNILSPLLDGARGNLSSVSSGIVRA